MTFTAANTNTARFAWTAPAVVETKAAPLSIAAVIADALDASAEAAFAALDQLGGDRGDCGGAWVVIKARKGRKALQAALAARNIRVRVGDGLNVYILRGQGWQSRYVYEKGCDAFVRVLEAAGIEAHTYSFAD
jgi:hypothetical protein